MQTIEVDSYMPARTPVHGSKALSTTPVDLGGAGNITSTSDTGWDLHCASAWLFGDSSAQLRAVAANESFRVESCTLAGCYAVVGSGTPTLVATGFIKVHT
jgi:hypothetical protein